jgi:hypothetical protein
MDVMCLQFLRRVPPGISLNVDSNRSYGFCGRSRSFLKAALASNTGNTALLVEPELDLS